MNSANNRNPVLLIHGINDTAAVFHKMAPYLTNLGLHIYDISLAPNNGDLALDRLAQQVADYIAKTFTPSQPLDILGFSMGGIVSRYYIQRLGGIDRVQRFVSLSSPHNGTRIAYLSQRPGCIQMQPNSAFLQDLNRDVAQLDKLNFTSIWTPFDSMIVPASSSKLPIGKNVQVPVLLHPWMLIDPKSLSAVATALCEPIKGDRSTDVVNQIKI